MRQNEYILEIYAELHVNDNLSTFSVRAISVVDPRSYSAKTRFSSG